MPLPNRRACVFSLLFAASLLVLLTLSPAPLLADDGFPPPEEERAFAPVVPPRPPPAMPLPREAAPPGRTPSLRMSVEPLPDHRHDPVGLEVLVIAPESSESGLDAIQAFLDQIGVPYDTLITTQTELAPSMLWDGIARGYYQGIILTTARLLYNNAGVWDSTFTSQEWQILSDYEAMFGIRQVTWYTYPSGLAESDGLQLVSELDTTLSPLPTLMTPEGRGVFSYLNPGATIILDDAYVYLPTVISPTDTIPLLVTSDGYAIASIHRYPDGRESLALTVSHSRHNLHSMLLSYGVINWVTNGLFLGERHVSLDAQVDDIFFWAALWDPAALRNDTGLFYRLVGADWDALVGWQNGVRSTVPNASALKVEMAFNGRGAEPGFLANDTLTLRVVAEQGSFNWVSHTYNHPLLNTISHTDALAELVNNDNAARGLGFAAYHKDALVQPAISGLYNPDFHSAAAGFGIKYLLASALEPGWGNPSPNAGIYSSFQPSILILPRHPLNIWYDVSTPAEWVSEYNHYYGPNGIHWPFWDHDLSYAEILDKQSDMWLRFLLNWDIDPVEFHQTNLRAYDGTHSLMSDLIDATLAKYNQLYNLPIQSPSMHALGGLVARRMAYDASGVQGFRVQRGSRIQCSSISLTVDQAALIPVTGLDYGAQAEQYGGQAISHIQLAAGETITVSNSGAPCQRIAFDPLPDKTILDATFPVTATASSGLPVSLYASGNCTLNGNLISLTGLGTCTVTARQAGSADYDPALDVKQSFNITKANVAVSVSPSANPVTIGQPITLTATVAPQGGAATPEGTVSFVIDQVNVATLPVGADGRAAYTATELETGIHQVAAVYSGDAVLHDGASPPLSLYIAHMLYLPSIAKP